MPGPTPWKRRGLTTALAALAGTFGAACSLALNFSGIDDGVRDASPDAPNTIDDAGGGGLLDRTSPSSDATTDARIPRDAPASSSDSSASSEDASDAAAAPDTSPVCTPGPCGCLYGPAMVSIDDGGFCIDSTEVTVAQYISFLTAKGGDTSGQDPICSFNTSLVPASPYWPPSGPSDQAISHVNWCQAQDYCEWAGKHLCGSFDGTPGDPSGGFDPTQSTWYYVCTHDNDGLHPFPYGLTYEPTACNGADYDAGGPLPSLSSCQGGYPGVFDMSGNVFEWEDRCVTSEAGPANDYCFIRGGAYDQPESDMRCDEGIEVTRGYPSYNVGFRCCVLE